MAVGIDSSINYTKLAITFLLTCVVCGHLIGCSSNENSANGSASTEYTALLEKFPVGSQGKGLDPLFTSEETHHASTYAQILSSESFHYKDSPNLESSQRIREAVKWLLDNADTDNDGKPGWGFPFPWDAFGDGSVNPANQPYTIDTALVAVGLLDALTVEEFWSPEEKQRIVYALRDVFSRWCSEVWTRHETNSAYFMYSTNTVDDYDVINVSSMFIGCLQRFIKEYGYMLSQDELALYANRADSAAKSIIDKVVVKFDGPFWNYIESPLFGARVNDLVHHVYILFGMEMYRTYGGKEALPWTLDQGVKSLDLFFIGSKLYNYPQDASFASPLIDLNTPANLWGIGMLMAFYGKSSHIDKIEPCMDIIKNEYGQFPDVTIFPANHAQDTTFYPRFAAHVLYGIAVRDFPGQAF
jgi:hypothetical protein